MSGVPQCDRPLHRQDAEPLLLATAMCRSVMSAFRRHQECDRLDGLLRRTERTGRLGSPQRASRPPGRQTAPQGFRVGVSMAAGAPRTGTGRVGETRS